MSAVMKPNAIENAFIAKPIKFRPPAWNTSEVNKSKKSKETSRYNIDNIESSNKSSTMINNISHIIHPIIGNISNNATTTIKIPINSSKNGR